MIIKVDPVMMAEMKDTMLKGAEEMEDTLHRIIQIAEMLEEGGLVGDAGEKLSRGLRTNLFKKVRFMHDKFKEIADDIQRAVDSMEDADESSGGIMGMS